MTCIERLTPYREDIARTDNRAAIFKQDLSERMRRLKRRATERCDVYLQAISQIGFKLIISVQYCKTVDMSQMSLNWQTYRNTWSNRNKKIKTVVCRCVEALILRDSNKDWLVDWLYQLHGLVSLYWWGRLYTDPANHQFCSEHDQPCSTPTLHMRSCVVSL